MYSGLTSQRANLTGSLSDQAKWAQGSPALAAHDYDNFASDEIACFCDLFLFLQSTSTLQVCVCVCASALGNK